MLQNPKKKQNKMKSYKNTTWNRLFHGKEVKANVELKKKAQKLIELAPSFIERIGYVTFTEGDPNSAKVTGVTSLLNVLALHKEAWTAGFQNNGICPCSYGYFRTESIEKMKPEEVYLGDIYGLFTKNIPFWEQYKNEGKTGGGYDIYTYLTDYQIVLRQYKGQLTFNIKKINEDAEKEVARLEALGY